MRNCWVSGMPVTLHPPVSPEEEEVALVVQRHDLSAAEHWEGREERAKQPTDGVTQQRREAIQDQLGCHVSACEGKKLQPANAREWAVGRACPWESQLIDARLVSGLT